MTRLCPIAARTALALALFAAAPATAAEVCVEVDEQTDTLSETDRRGALGVARAAFGKAGQTVVDAPCDRSYTISNSALGQTVYVTIRGPKGQRDGKVNSIDELGDLYQQLVVSLVKGKPMSAGVSRHNVTATQNEVNRLRADALYFLTVGGAYLNGLDLDAVPLHIGGGYRHELDQFAIEGNVSMAFATASNDGGGVNVHFGLGGYYFFDPAADSSTYIGLGLGYGGGGQGDDTGGSSGAGLQAQASVGYEMLRASTIRAFVQADALLPMYQQKADDQVDGRDVYAPVFNLKIGIGWAPL